MEVKHTPGPWYHEADSHTGAVTTEGKKLIASVFGDDPECREDDRQIANATLIAAAPDLLAALQDLMRPHGGTRGVAWDHLIAVAARAAIAKATGA